MLSSLRSISQVARRAMGVMKRSTAQHKSNKRNPPRVNEMIDLLKLIIDLISGKRRKRTPRLLVRCQGWR